MEDLVPEVSCEHKYSTAFDRWGMATCRKCGTFLGWEDPRKLDIKIREKCGKCGGMKDVGLDVFRDSAGNEHIRWHCAKCGGWSKISISHADARITIDYYQLRKEHDQTFVELPVTDAVIELLNLRNLRKFVSCEIRGCEGVAEYHHLMPQAFAEHELVKDEWEQWDRVGFWLCKRHHMVWHKLVAPLSRLKRKVKDE